MITMALAKGRIYQETLPFLAAAGIRFMSTAATAFSFRWICRSRSAG